jgi:5-methylcytosine-specific restriction endonuclease McrA
MELLTTEYVVDHIVPHTHGGQTLIENGEVTTKEYNSWKGKRIYDNEMTIS